MQLFEQLDFFTRFLRRAPDAETDLEIKAREFLRDAGFEKLSPRVRVEWNSRMRSAAGRADFRTNLISLNPRLRDHGEEEVERTLRHELAHLLAHARAGRRRIAPHGNEWRKACADLGIPDEARCHTLPFPTSLRAKRYLYECPRCHREFPRVKRIRRALACLECCREFNRGQFDPTAKLRLVKRPNE